MTKPTSHSIELRNDLCELPRMSTWLQQASRLLALPDVVASELDVCANEAVTNIINYAYDDAASHRIKVQLTQISDQVDLEVEDDGKPFNPLEYPPQKPTTLALAPLGGRGILLIRGLMSECRYRRQEGKNILTMVLRSPAAAA